MSRVSSSIFDAPKKALLFMAFWWLFWISIANLPFNPLIYPEKVTFLVLGFVVVLLYPYFLIKTPKIIVVEKSVMLRPIFIWILVLIGFYIIIFKALPAIISDPLGYRLSTFNDNNSGIESVLFSDSKSEFFFNLVYLQFPIAFLLLSVLISSKKLFKQCVLLLLIYSTIRLWRGGIYVSIFYLFMNGFHISFKEKYPIFFKSIIFLLVSTLFFFKDILNEILIYHTVGFSLLENIFVDITSKHDDNYFSFYLLLGPIASIVRQFSPNFFFDFELYSSNFSKFIDIGRIDSLSYNAYYTFFVAPVYDYGVFGPLLLSFFLSSTFILVNRFKCSFFVKKAFLLLIFHTTIFGIFQNSLSDFVIIAYVLTILFYKTKIKKYIFIDGK